MASISRAFARTERGTQSSERSSSMIEPLIRDTANVSNLIWRSGSNRSIAPIRPEQAVGDQVRLLDVSGQPARHPARDELHQRRVGEHELLAGPLVTALLVASPQLLEVEFATSRVHAQVRVASVAYARGWLCVVQSAQPA